MIPPANAEGSKRVNKKQYCASLPSTKLKATRKKTSRTCRRCGATTTTWATQHNNPNDLDQYTPGTYCEDCIIEAIRAYGFDRRCK